MPRLEMILQALKEAKGDLIEYVTTRWPENSKITFSHPSGEKTGKVLFWSADGCAVAVLVKESRYVVSVENVKEEDSNE